MAEKRKGVKWIIVVTVLVLIAIGVTLGVVLAPKNTGKAIEQTSKQAETMFIATDTDEETYKTFQSKLRVIVDDEYGVETESVYKLSMSLNEIMNFYSDNIVFAKNNKVFQKNYNVIMRNYSRANDEQEKMQDIMEDVNKQLGNMDVTFFDGAWKKFRSHYVSYVSYYSKSIQGLNKVFRGCLPKGVLANEMTYLVLDNVDAYLTAINKDFSKAGGKINYLDDFVGYLKKDNQTLSKYEFSETLQEKIKLVQSFASVYGQGKTLAELVNGINESGFTFTSEVQDPKGVLNACKAFLKGEISL